MDEAMKLPESAGSQHMMVTGHPVATPTNAAGPVSKSTGKRRKTR